MFANGGKTVSWGKKKEKKEKKSKPLLTAVKMRMKTVTPIKGTALPE